MRTAISLIMLLALAASTVPTTNASVAHPVTTTNAPTTNAPTTNGKVCPSKVDLTFVMDISGSIPSADWPTVKNFFSSITARFIVSQSLARIGIVTFAANAKRRIQLKGCANAACINTDLDVISHVTDGGTATSAALNEAANGYTVPNGDRPGVPNVVVLFTDGKSNILPTETIPAGEALKSTKNVTLFVVAIGNDTDVNVTELQALATDPDSVHLLRIVDRNFSNLLGFVDPIAVQACPPLPKCTCSNLLTTQPPTTTITLT